MLQSIAQMASAGLLIESILHVGANEGQERLNYQWEGASPCFYVEPVREVFETLKQNVSTMPWHFAIEAVCSDVEGQEIAFHVASNGGQSSSFLELGRCAVLHPEIRYTSVELMTTTTVDRLIEKHSPRRVPNLFIIDTQGADLHVLRGARRSLPCVDGVFIEVSEQPLYAGGCTREQIARFLADFGLHQRWIMLDANGNGDAFFCRDKTAPLPMPEYRGNLARGKAASQSSTCQWSHYFTADGPGGGVNGYISGFFGFHTDEEDQPWWQVDLGAIQPLQEVRIFNRLDAARQRSRTLRVFLSHDCITWRLVHDQGGYTFGGNDGRPLRVMLSDQSARYVRLQLNERSYFHLDEVEVY
jgi:FkbM family methyltransferase